MSTWSPALYPVLHLLLLPLAFLAALLTLRWLSSRAIETLFEAPYYPHSSVPARRGNKAPSPGQPMTRLLVWLPRVGWRQLGLLLRMVLVGLICLWLLSGCGTPRSSLVGPSPAAGLPPLPAALMQPPASPVPLMPLSMPKPAPKAPA